MSENPLDDEKYRLFLKHEKLILKRIVYYLDFTDDAKAAELYEHCNHNLSYHEFVALITKFRTYCHINSEKIYGLHRYRNRPGELNVYTDRWRENYDRDIIYLMPLEKERKINL